MIHLTLRGLICLLLLCPALLPNAVQASAPLTLTLPSADTYCYWVQSKGGPVTTLPVRVRHQSTVLVSVPLAAGDQVIVLDAHTGEVASRAVTLDSKKAVVPITLTIADFLPLSTPALTPVPSAPVTKDAAVPVPAEPSVALRFVTGLLSLLLAVGVGWVVLHLIQTRGEPLRQLARRAGVDVPDPKPLEEDAPAAEAAVYEPPRRTPLAIPDEAGLPPLPGTVRGPQIPLADIPALHGLQGLAAGSTFALTAGDVTIGRDGENEIVLAENTVSRRHARVLRDSQGQFTVTDLGSANGVYVNGTRVQRAVLSAGDEVKIGDNYFRFHASETHTQTHTEIRTELSKEIL